jgi:hypothetical protein
MNVTFEQVSPEVAQALAMQASSQGLSVNDYLRCLLGMNNSTAAAELAVADMPPAAPPCNEAMLKTIREVEELMKDIPIREAVVAQPQTVSTEESQPTPAPRNEEMLATIRRSRERLKDMPVRGSTEETLLMIRKARAGEMWGYEPTDYE